ncbi:protein of unknown function DUF6 transmembrane [Kosmotoga olearia TBF 19.5.1]|uniref:EamA domain-containing protein n=2 Tax=Kosmotoga TaxID=651456 RepID=C5CDP0_KOSOT|nr:protein of unknown function DUF6 transmembrane [Kosmotoga olearia TBF 19.5.1]
MSILSTLYLAITLLFFSSMEIVSKPLMGQIDPFFMTAFRFFIGGLFLMPLIEKKLPPREIILLTMIGSLNTIVSMTFLQLSVKFGNASTAATLIATNPLFVTIFAPFFGSEKPSKRKFIGTFLGFVGILIFISGMLEGDTITGFLFGIGSAISFALYTLLLKPHVLKHGALTATAYSSFFSGVVYSATLMLFGQFKITSLNLSSWLILLYLGIGVTGIAYFTFFAAAKRIGASTASRVFYLKPVVATLLAFIFLSEEIGAFKLIGIVVIILSLMI